MISVESRLLRLHKLEVHLMRNSRLTTAVVGAALAVAMLGGCGSNNSSPAPSGPSAPTSSGPKNLVVGLSDKPISLDPQDTNDNLSFGIENTVYEGLLSFDKDMRMIPVLAENLPDASADAKTFTFHLRKGVKFQDGQPLNSAAVKASFERVLNKDNKLRRNSLFAPIDSIDAPDDSTVVFKLKEPFGAMVPTFAHPAGKILAPSTFSKGPQQGKDFLHDNMVGTGPFKLKSYDKQQGIVEVEKNPDYWNKSQGPNVDAIAFKPMSEAATRVNALKAGEIQFLASVPPAQADELKGAPNINVVASKSVYSFYMAFNVNVPPFNKKEVRQAINYAIDKDALRKAVLRGYADPMDTPIPAGIQHSKSVGTYPHDVAKAKALLAQAGYQNGFEATVWMNTSTERRDMATAIQAQLKEVGIKVTPEPMDAPTLNSKIWSQSKETTKMQMYLGGWSASTGDADWGLRPLLYGDAGPNGPQNLYNVGYYSQPEVNTQVENALKTADESKRAAYYAKAQELIWEDAPWAFLYVPNNIIATTKNISGAFMQGDGILQVQWVKLS